MKLILRVAGALILGYLTLLLTAWWADHNPSVAALIGGHNIVLQVFVTLPLGYFLVGTLPYFRRKTVERTVQ